MAGTSVSVIGARCVANAAAVATALAGGTSTADATALGNILITLATCPDLMIPLLGEATTPALASTMLNPA